MYMLLFILLSIMVTLVGAIVIIIKLPDRIRTYVLGSVLVVAIVLVGYGTYRYHSIERDGEVRLAYVRMGDRYYEDVNIDFSKEGKIIGKFDDYDIREIPEDPEHNFLVVRTFLDQYYVVDREYVIPTEGELSCAYVDVQACDKEMIVVLNAIFKEEYEDKFLVRIPREEANFHGIRVGYGDCPVATDFGGYIGTLEDGRWVWVYQEDYEYDSEKDMIYATCYKIPDEYWDALQESGEFD